VTNGFITFFKGPLNLLTILSASVATAFLDKIDSEEPCFVNMFFDFFKFQVPGRSSPPKSTSSY